MLSASAHKFNGPKGIGFIYIKSGTKIFPYADGGAQEHGMRAGTENIASIVGMAAALKKNCDHMDQTQNKLHQLEDKFLDVLKLSGIDFTRNGSANHIPGNVNVSIRNVSGEMLLHRLDLKGKENPDTNAWGGKNMSRELTPKTGQFDEIISIIDNARTRALKAVNAELIQMYWNVGEYLSSLCADSGFGDKVIDEVAAYIAEANPGVKGFNRRGLYRMKQFYETYKDDEFVTPLVTQISWTNHLLIMSGSKSAEERHFYMTLCAKEHYSKRELERQMDSAYYERYMLSSKKLIPESVPQDVRGSILDTYVLEFLDLPEQYSERNLRKAITGNLKQFILEFGKDFTFIGEEYRVQVGGQDFYIDLLFYNRALSCLVPIELKIGKFKPEHIGQINFYLEALDRDVKKPNENPSVGVILCASKDDAVVEYALSRSMSPTLVADYRLCLPDKTLLQNKLRELTELALESGERDEDDEE